MAPPFQEAEFDITYGEGISKTGEILDVGWNAGIIDKSGSWYSYKGERIGQGRENVKKFFADNDNLRPFAQHPRKGIRERSACWRPKSPTD
jgi:recombination protein RecA